MYLCMYVYMHRCMYVGAMCRPLLLLSDASSTRAGARCLRCRQTCHRCGEYGLHERTSATSWARLNGITCHGGTDPRPHLEPLPAPWAAHHPVATFASHSSFYVQRDVGGLILPELNHSVTIFPR